MLLRALGSLGEELRASIPLSSSKITTVGFLLSASLDGFHFRTWEVVTGLLDNLCVPNLSFLKKKIILQCNSEWCFSKITALVLMGPHRIPSENFSQCFPREIPSLFWTASLKMIHVANFVL